MPKVRLTLDPDREYEVGEREVLDLRRQGLLVEDDSSTKAEPKTRRRATSEEEN